MSVAMDWCSRTPQAMRWPSRASTCTTSRRHRWRAVSRCASTTSATPACPWRSPGERIRRQSKRAWDIRRSPSRSIAMGTYYPVSTPTSPTGSIGRYRRRKPTEIARSFMPTSVTTLWLLGRIDAWRSDGYEVRLVFVSLPNVELALARVAARVAAGGHDVPEGTVRRRFTSGLRYFFHALPPPSRRMGSLRQRGRRSRADREWGPPRGARARLNDVRQTPCEVERDFEVE